MSLGDPIFYHFLDSVDSTNLWVRLHHTTFDLNCLHIVYAAEQTQGKGTQGKSWASPKDLNIYATIFFRATHIDPTLAQVLSVSITTVLNSKGFSAAIKWPNDLMLDHKKIGGILCELVPTKEGNLVILGFGLNVNMPQQLCNLIDKPTSSLFASSGKLFAITPLLYLIGEQFQKDLLLYVDKGFSSFWELYNSRMPYQGYPVELHGQPLGTSQHINSRGELNILSPEGAVRSITSGSICL